MNPTNWAWLFTVLTCVLWCAMAVKMLMYPRVSRPDIFFAITVDPSFRQSPTGRAILRCYDRLVVIITLVSFALAVPISLPPSWFHTSLSVFLAAVALEMAGFLGAFLIARHRTMPHRVEPSTAREADLHPRRGPPPAGWLAQAGPFLILAAASLYLWLRWDDILARFPSQWGSDGRPSGWTTKGVVGVFCPIGLGALVCLLIAVLSRRRGVRWTYRGDSRSPYGARFVRIRSAFLLGLQYWLALYFAAGSLGALGAKSPMPGLWWLPFAFAVLVAWFMAFWIAQRRWPGGASERVPVGDQTPDKCWKLGLFYVNRNDPAVLVEKRFGIGWTVNFGNPRLWLVIGATLLLLLAILGLLTVKGGTGIRPTH
ncbi:MAG: DUF5808 domain-containing protein [Verrucomicrobiia bacterium]